MNASDSLVTALDEERFTAGDCHYLARAISKRTGWPIAAFDHNGPDLHAFVLMPDGRALDVYGPQTIRQMRKRWHTTDGIVRVDWNTIRAAFGRSAYGRSTYDRAAKLSQRLLAQVGVAG